MAPRCAPQGTRFLEPMRSFAGRRADRDCQHALARVRDFLCKPRPPRHGLGTIHYMSQVAAHLSRIRSRSRHQYIDPVWAIRRKFHLHGTDVVHFIRYMTGIPTRTMMRVSGRKRYSAHGLLSSNRRGGDPIQIDVRDQIACHQSIRSIHLGPHDGFGAIRYAFDWIEAGIAEHRLEKFPVNIVLYRSRSHQKKTPPRTYGDVSGVSSPYWPPAAGPVSPNNCA